MSSRADGSSEDASAPLDAREVDAVVLETRRWLHASSGWGMAFAGACAASYFPFLLLGLVPGENRDAVLWCVVVFLALAVMRWGVYLLRRGKGPRILAAERKSVSVTVVTLVVAVVVALVAEVVALELWAFRAVFRAAPFAILSIFSLWRAAGARLWEHAWIAAWLAACAFVHAVSLGPVVVCLLAAATAACLPAGVSLHFRWRRYTRSLRAETIPAMVEQDSAAANAEAGRSSEVGRAVEDSPLCLGLCMVKILAALNECAYASFLFLLGVTGLARDDVKSLIASLRAMKHIKLRKKKLAGRYALFTLAPRGRDAYAVYVRQRKNISRNGDLSPKE